MWTRQNAASASDYFQLMISLVLAEMSDLCKNIGIYLIFDMAIEVHCAILNVYHMLTDMADQRHNTLLQYIF